MAVKYISYIQTEILVRNWKTLQGIRESLALDIQSLGEKPSQEEIDDYILTQVVGNKVMSDIPPSGSISDTTANTSASYKQIIKSGHSNALRSLREEKLCIELIDDKLNIAFRRLTVLQRRILTLFYLESKTWTEVLSELKEEKHFISRSNAQKYRRVSIEKVCSISKITTDVYLKAMNLVEVD